MRIYIGNLDAETTLGELVTLFAPFGRVNMARLALDHQTGAPRGFGILEMGDADARSAIGQLHGTRAGGRRLRIREVAARPATGAAGETPGQGASTTIALHDADRPGSVDPRNCPEAAPRRPRGTRAKTEPERPGPDVRAAAQQELDEWPDR